MWKLLASTRVTSTGASRRPFTAARPPNPAPTTTTRCRHERRAAIAKATSVATRQLFSASARLAGMLRARGDLADPAEHEWRHRRSGDAAGLRIAEGGDEDLVEVGGVERVGLGDRHGEEDARRRGGPGERAPRPRPPPTPPGGARAGPTSGCRRRGTSRAASRAPARPPSPGARGCGGGRGRPWRRRTP